MRLALLLAGAALRLAAHDFWIEPASFFPEPGQTMPARLRVGQELIGDPLPRDPGHIRQFVVEDAAGRRAPVPGRAGADPAGFLRAAAPGLNVVGYWSNLSPVEQPPDKFAQYLKEEGLDEVAAAMRARAASGAPVKELFARCAKSLVLAGGKPVPGETDRALGFTLELVAEKSPYALAAGEAMPVRLTYEGKPLAGALVVAFPRADPSMKVSGRTAADGRVRLKLPAAPGLWLVKAVHMVPAPSGSGAQWQSYWASLTFGSPERK